MEEQSELERIRMEKLEAYRDRGMEAFPARVERTHTTLGAVQAFESGEDETEITAVIVGRIRSIREMGKVIFSHVEDGMGQLQLFLRKDDIGGESFNIFREQFDLGDFIEAKGVMFRTRTGEVTLKVGEFRMLAKALAPLPASKTEEVDGERVVHSAFADPEARYRQRYADLAVNPEVREVFRTRARIIRALRGFFDERGFVEVETPILQPVYGGAAAKPFTTHHNQLHQDLFLRISFELYLKR